MNASEFWCRAFLGAMSEHIGDLERCEEVANGALWRAQQRGMVTPAAAQTPQEPKVERLEFTAERADHGLWDIKAEPFGVIRVCSEQRTTQLNWGRARIVWGQTVPPRPIEVWIERPAA
jgi:hypothetical protein